MRTAFSLFDVDRDGTISVDDLLTVLKNLGIKRLDSKEIRKMMTEKNPLSTGYIDYENFRKIV